MADDKNASSHFSPFSSNEFLKENSSISESEHIFSQTTNPNTLMISELTEESMEDNPSSSAGRHMGRPSGSKNKPKPPMIIMENSIADMENIILEIPIGNDVVETIIDFAKRHEARIVVVNGSGLVSDVTLLLPNSRIPAFQLDGPFNVLSLAGAYLNPDYAAFSLQLSGSRGQVFGGVIGGKINAASDIHISASLFKRPEFIKAVTTNGNVQLFEDYDIATITGCADANNGGETQSVDQILP
ncbi:AT-hook motif nuclear-localized protein 15-like [Vicia villosa]|uniref:AT-hook motif nuclear-localized protein 15-like n=1 Tax=Vicia villosa TaxID=3911 RepID=UPI00273A8B62|nr:AT-hook motif nuclear-localized protein 15-like [Vicia villosa]